MPFRRQAWRKTGTVRVKACRGSDDRKEVGKQPSLNLLLPTGGVQFHDFHQRRVVKIDRGIVERAMWPFSPTPRQIRSMGPSVSHAPVAGTDGRGGRSSAGSG